MQIRRRESIPALLPIGAAAATAGLMALAWYADARRRARYGSRLHRTLVELLLNTLSAGDPITERHCRRVAALTDSFATVCGFARHRRATLRVASLLHDMGKLDDEFAPVLHSTGRLDEEGRQRIKGHPHESAHILEPLEPFHRGLMRIVESHHERWDGTGYPRGLGAEEIPLEARIISVADVFDALTQSRRYKQPSSVEEALAEIRRGAGSRFDPAVVEMLGRPEVLSAWAAIAQRGWRQEGRAPAADAPRPAQR